MTGMMADQGIPLEIKGNNTTCMKDLCLRRVQEK
jgi:hypothetical protein